MPGEAVLFLKLLSYRIYTHVQADNFLLNFDIQVVEVGLYMGHAIQPETTVSMMAICQ